MPDWAWLLVVVAVLDWGYARLCLRDERRYRRDLNQRVRAYMREHGDG